jgi:hypothetical protein
MRVWGGTLWRRRSSPRSRCWEQVHSLLALLVQQVLSLLALLAEEAHDAVGAGSRCIVYLALLVQQVLSLLALLAQQYRCRKRPPSFLLPQPALLSLLALLVQQVQVLALEELRSKRPPLADGCC